jgi:2-iminobutanoate/2-iminopropanoate deaminase
MSKKIYKKSIHASAFLNEPVEYCKSFSRGIKIVHGDIALIIISGTASIDKNGKTLYPGNFKKQVARTFANITALIASEGANWQDVVQTRCYLKDMKNYNDFNIYRNWFYREQKLVLFPASACVEATLCRPELLVEIEAMAIRKNPRKRM